MDIKIDRTKPRSTVSSRSQKNVEPMDKDQSEMFIKLVMAEAMEQKGDAKPLPPIAEEDLPFTSKVVAKRIEALSLPISFNTFGYLTIEVFARGNPGRAVTILIDCLTEYEGEEIGTNELSKLYPWGFYTEEALIEKIDYEFKPHEVLWSEIYQGRPEKPRPRRPKTTETEATL